MTGKIKQEITKGNKKTAKEIITFGDKELFILFIFSICYFQVLSVTLFFLAKVQFDHL